MAQTPPLEKIGFYTLSDYRATQISTDSPLWRCELILTDTCNFTCPYCRGIEEKNRGDMSWEDASFIVTMWGEAKLKNIRFSGGEPTMWHVVDTSGSKRNLIDLVKLAKDVGIERIAVSTNGSIKTSFYLDLIKAGVNDFSISLDSCCAETGDKMAGNKPGAWHKVIHNIKTLSEHTYVTVGVVFTPENAEEFLDLVAFADTLGVHDIRILSSAQWNKGFYDIKLDPTFLAKYPILKYRMEHFAGDRHVRGIRETDSHTCPLMQDDMAILNGNHYPCIIYMREQGAPVGKVDFRATPQDAIKRVRQERLEWIETNDTHTNAICSKNCLDVCVDFNNKINDTNAGSPKLRESLKRKTIFPLKVIAD